VISQFQANVLVIVLNDKDHELHIPCHLVDVLSIHHHVVLEIFQMNDVDDNFHDKHHVRDIHLFLYMVLNKMKHMDDDEEHANNVVPHMERYFLHIHNLCDIQFRNLSA
jgi:hypothetical protein